MGPWLIKALNAALLLVSCYLVADVATEIGASAIEPSPVQPAAIRPQTQDAVAAAAPTAILQRNLFGAQLAGDIAVADRETLIDVPLAATKLPLRLLGTAAASQEERSRAAIEDEKTKKHLVVAVGDPLEGHRGVSVAAIERSRVILNNGGRREELALNADQEGTARPKRRRPARQARRARPAKNTLNDRLKALNGEDGAGISRILSSARIVPHYEDGQMLGMKVDAIKADSLFEKVGLANGDVITEVNGIVVDRLEATSAIFEELSTAQEINVAATRGGNALFFNASANELTEQ